MAPAASRIGPRSGPSVGESAPFGESLGDLVQPDLPVSDGDQKVEGVVRRRSETDSVQAEEEPSGKPPRALVAVDEPMISNERLEQRGGLGLQAVVGVFTEGAGRGPMEG